MNCECTKHIAHSRRMYRSGGQVGDARRTNTPRHNVRAQQLHLCARPEASNIVVKVRDVCVRPPQLTRRAIAATVPHVNKYILNETIYGIELLRGRRLWLSDFGGVARDEHRRGEIAANPLCAQCRMASPSSRAPIVVES